MEYPLSSKDIQQYLKNVKIILYKDLQNYYSAKDLVRPHNQVVIMFKTSSDFGHWCCLLKNHSGYEFFDPYGLFLDDQLETKMEPDPDEDEEMFKLRYGQDTRWLTKLLAKVDEPVSYNHHKFQAFKLPDGTRPQTCGKWCILRLLNYEKPLDEFKEGVDLLSDYYSSPDEAVGTVIKAYGERYRR